MTSMTRSTPSTPICNPQLPPPTETNAGALQPSAVRQVATPRPCLPPKDEATLDQVGYHHDALRIAQHFFRDSFVWSRHDGVQNFDGRLQTGDRVFTTRACPRTSSNHAYEA